jgi:hypothetical protein
LEQAGKRAQEAKEKPKGYVIKQREETPPPEGAEDVTPEDAKPTADDLMAQEQEYQRAQRELAVYRAEDRNAELVKVVKMRDNFERQCNELMDQNNALSQRLKFFSGQLKRVGKAVGVDDPTKVAPTVEGIMRNLKAAKEAA